MSDPHDSSAPGRPVPEEPPSAASDPGALLSLAKQYQELVNSLPAIIWEADPVTYRFTYVSPQAHSILGYSPESWLTDLSWQDLIHADDCEWVFRKCRAYTEAGQNHVLEFRVWDAKGRVVWVRDHTSVFMSQGKPVKLLGVLTDITEQKRAEQDLREKTEQLQAVTDPITTFLASQDWREPSAQLLRSALRQTQSVYGFIGVVVDGPVLRILAHEGILWDQKVNHEFYASAMRAYRDKGYLEFKNLANLFGHTITGGEVVLSNDPGADARSSGLPPGHPPLRHFLGVPVRRNQNVVGMIGVANRPGGYTGREVAQLETLMQAAGLLYDAYRRQQRQVDLESQLQQSQKMEAIGQLAGGVAHDFNNLLVVITGFTELLLQQFQHHEAAQRSLSEILQAGRKATNLTQQLLAFSRRQMLAPKVVDLNAVVASLSSMLPRLLGEDIDLSTTLDPALGRVKIDPGQLEQVLVNLAVNARDAMPKGGRLMIETANIDATSSAELQQLLVPGSYVSLTVKDTGCGINPQVQSRIFEPFFTTKERGKGTGLGLSTAYGIIEQSGGHMVVESQLGQGAAFKIYLSRTEEVLDGANTNLPQAPNLDGTETILLVEDEPAVRDLARQVLRGRGYRVLEARHALEAQIISGQYGGRIDLLLTDVVLPQVSGFSLAQNLINDRPDLKVIFMSGYSEELVSHHGVVSPGQRFLQKPFTTDGLARVTREMLNASQK